ncbi:hypothetical protein VKT23_017938 [Stygiomarasmius scandens]|uniref:Enoyl reductase (ER) domain-containing protein n=1 Tax=Marasmiellus scandens TaxID=2682957 RepID=A0ABR1IQR7_9AGAR
MSEQKALLLESKHGSFVVSSIPKPSTASAGELIVKVQAAGLNPIDWKIQSYGLFYEEYPAITGSDVAGDVEQVGEGVVGFKKGDRVLLQGNLKSDYAGFQQYVRAPAELVAKASTSDLTKIPENISYSQAASIPLGLATAAVGLYAKQPSGISLNPSFDAANYSGQAALVIGGSSSVGQYAIQLLRYAKFEPIIAYSSAHHFEYLKLLGATICIDRKQVSLADLPAAVKKLTNSPIKIVYDAIGSGESEQAGYDALAADGNMVTTGAQGKIDSKKIHRVFGSVHTPPPNREFGKAMYKNLTKLLEDGVIVPNKIEDLPNGLNGINDGLERLKKNQVSGVKLIARPQETS